MGKSNKAARRQRINARIDREERVDLILNYAGSAFVALVAIALALQLYSTVLQEPLYVTLSPSDSKQLGAVFFGGDPWLVFCTDSKGTTKKADGSLHPTLIGAAEQLRDNGISFVGALDCSAKLPSGMNTYERLKLNASLTPVMFLALGGDRPQQLGLDLLKEDKPGKSKKKKKGDAVDGDGRDSDAVKKGTKLANAVAARTRRRFSVKKIQDTTGLQKACLQRKLCGLFIGRGSSVLGTSYAQELGVKMTKAFRTSHWAYLDSSELQISMHKLLPEVASQTGMPRFVAFRKFQTSKDRLPAFTVYQKQVESSYELIEFMQDFISASEDELKELPKLPTIRRTRSKPASTAQRPTRAPRESSQEDQAPAPPTSESDEERMRRKREEMEREAEDIVSFMDVDEESEEDYAGGEEDEIDDYYYDTSGDDQDENSSEDTLEGEEELDLD